MIQGIQIVQISNISSAQEVELEDILRSPHRTPKGRCREYVT